MATLKYFTKGTSNPSTIYLRFAQGRNFDLKKSTSLLIDPKYWNNKKGVIRQIAGFNNKLNIINDLNGLRTHILNQFNKDYANGELINSDWLKTSINDFFDQSDSTDFNYIVDYAKYYKETSKTKIQSNGKVGVATASLTKYQTIINKLNDFEKHNNKRLKVIDINLKFHKDFIHYLSTVQKLNFNTIGKYLNFVKTIVKDAENYGIKVNNDISKREFRPTKEDVLIITFSETEIQKIYNHKFIKGSYLDNARNWLIIGLWTGARVSDLLNFTKESINENGLIDYTSKKTKQKVVVGLHPQVKETLKRNKGDFPRKISDQNFNVYIKKVCKEVGLNEKVKGSKIKEIKKGVFRKVKNDYLKYKLVTSHICRRSFATNHYGKLPTPVIMSITGHKTETEFLKYIGKTAKDNAEVLNDYWSKQEKKRENKTKLKIVNTGTNE